MRKTVGLRRGDVVAQRQRLLLQLLWWVVPGQQALEEEEEEEAARHLHGEYKCSTTDFPFIFFTLKYRMHNLLLLLTQLFDPLRCERKLNATGKPTSVLLFLCLWFHSK